MLVIQPKFDKEFRMCNLEENKTFFKHTHGVIKGMTLCGAEIEDCGKFVPANQITCPDCLEFIRESKTYNEGNRRIEMKTKPFNLEEALAGKPMVTRGGDKVIDFMEHKNVESIFKCTAVVYGNIRTFTTDGTYYGNEKSANDILMIDETISITGYVNVYPSAQRGSKYHLEGLFKTKKEAEQMTDKSIIKTVPITITI